MTTKNKWNCLPLGLIYVWTRKDWKWQSRNSKYRVHINTHLYVCYKKKIERDARLFKPQSPRDAQGLVTTCTSLQPLAPCKMKFSTSSIKEKLPVLFYFNARKIQNNVSKVIPSPLPTLLITSTQREFRDHLKAKRTLKSLGLEVLRTTDFQNEWELVTMKITFVVLSSGDNSR